MSGTPVTPCQFAPKVALFPPRHRRDSRALTRSAVLRFGFGYSGAPWRSIYGAGSKRSARKEQADVLLLFTWPRRAARSASGVQAASRRPRELESNRAKRPG